jgi:uncharacterized membrane protein SpoIIM required for sporulation
MNEELFATQRELDWARLTALCDKAEFNPTTLSSQELREFIRVYKRVSRDLSIARTQSDNAALIEYLNDLAGRAYGTLYRAPRRNLLTAIIDAISLSAQTVRRCWPFIAASASIFFGTAILVFFGIAAIPDLQDPLVPEGWNSVFDAWKSGAFQERSGSEGIAMTGFYASNNPRAALATGGIGAATLGLGSIYLLFTNGALMGTLANGMASVGKLGFLLASVFPHGVPEISGLVISGAAGLRLGYAVINPGRRSRGESLRAVGKDAFVLLSTSIVLMFIAAPIEGFFSFSPAVPQQLKVIVGSIEVVIWTLIWTRVGRTKPTDPQENSVTVRHSSVKL